MENKSEIDKHAAPVEENKEENKDEDVNDDEDQENLDANTDGIKFDDILVNLDEKFKDPIHDDDEILKEFRCEELQRKIDEEEKNVVPSEEEKFLEEIELQIELEEFKKNKKLYYTFHNNQQVVTLGQIKGRPPSHYPPPQDVKRCF